MFKISQEKQVEINEFLKTNIQKYPIQYQKVIIENLYDDNQMRDILLQIYSYKQAIIKELDPYYQFVDLLKEKFGDLENKKITEVACGFIPAISIALNNSVPKLNPLAVYDPKVLNIHYPNIVNHQTFFEENSEPNANLLIANLPCEALMLMIKIAVLQKKEMMVQTCSCFYNHILTRNEFTYYIDFLFDQLKQLEDYGFLVEK